MPLLLEGSRPQVSLAEQVAIAGWASTEACVAAELLDAIASELRLKPDLESERGGQRNVLTTAPAVVRLARDPAVRAVAMAVLGSEAAVVRALYFDKTPQANWKVAWHQDLTIAVQVQRDVPGYGAWSRKAGVWHVQPPAAVLEHMLAVRVHLDDSTTENGSLRVLEGSHRDGKLGVAEIEGWKARAPVQECLVPRGGILAFRPLLLHASSPARQPYHRRVVHLEFAAVELAGGLEWHERVT
jgi:ectoine hydroxylase-related dioxygenase (phytanoyl-CoA dioxygenase family)